MTLVVVAEIMFFAGFISAYIVNRSAALEWPPYGQPRLPVSFTMFNTAILLFSAFTLYRYNLFLEREQKDSSARKIEKPETFYLLLTFILGSLFLLLQGNEWVRLLRFGLTMTSGLYGAFFYLIIGAHGVHVLVGLLLLYLLIRKERSGIDPSYGSYLKAYSIYWYFVVFLWPVLYVLVYLL